MNRAKTALRIALIVCAIPFAAIVVALIGLEQALAGPA